MSARLLPPGRRRALGETIEIESVVSGGLWNISVDPHQLENVILNLAINARDAMPEGGKLTLELANATPDDGYVATLPDVPAGQYVMLAVTDTGTGMTREVMERAFEPFFSTKREGQGTGLGLSMAYGFVKQSGGHIRLYSEIGHGTTIRIYLPRSTETVLAEVVSTTVTVKHGNETILVVEDDPKVQSTVIELLTGLGYAVLKASRCGTGAGRRCERSAHRSPVYGRGHARTASQSGYGEKSGPDIAPVEGALYVRLYTKRDRPRRPT